MKLRKRKLQQDIPIRSYLALSLTTFMLLLLMWISLSYSHIVRPYFLPTPSEVLRSVGILFAKYNYLSDIGISIYRVWAAFLLSAVLGVPLGVFMGCYRRAEAIWEPLVDFIRYMPVAGFIPLSILWLGITDVQKIAILFIGTFFQLVPMVMDAAGSVKSEYLDISYTLGYSDRGIVRRVIVPAAMPGIFDALRISIAIAWTYVVVAEIVAAATGVGHMIVESQRYLQTARIFVGILTLGFLGLATDYIFKVLYAVFFPWSEKVRRR